MDNEMMTDEVLMYGEKEVRWYQIAVLHGVEDELEKGSKRILIELPTGSGKTLASGLVFSSSRVRNALDIDGDRPLRLLFIAHKHRLLTQAEREYADAVNVEFIPHSAFMPIPEDLEWDIAALDEAHHEAMTTIQLQLERLGNRPIIGMTTTPDRADGCLIKFEAIINPITREEAVNQGYLASTHINTIVDTAARDKTEITKHVIDEYGPEFGQTIMFFKTKREVREITAYLQSKGYNAIGILGQSEHELNDILDDFSDGKWQFVVNCLKINEGVDVKNCTDIYGGRQFGSYPQLNQVIGRASRPDSICCVWELVNPLSGRNLDTTVVVGTPESHRLLSRRGNHWLQQEFNCVSKRVTFDQKTLTVTM